MSIVKKNKGSFFHIGKKRRGYNPDVEDIYFGIYGEFSPRSDEAFKKHLGRLAKVVFFHRNDNG